MKVVFFFQVMVEFKLTEKYNHHLYFNQSFLVSCKQSEMQSLYVDKSIPMKKLPINI